MSRGLTTDQRNAALASHRVNVPLVEALFDSGPLRLAMCPWDIVVGDDTYIATGALLTIGPIKESSSSQEGLALTLSGLDAAIVELAVNEHYRGRIITIRKARLTPGTMALIGTPTIEWIGRMRNIPLGQTNETFDVTVEAEHYELELSRPSPRRWNDADQQRDYPGDKACEYVATMTEKYLQFPAKEALRK